MRYRFSAAFASSAGILVVLVAAGCGTSFVPAAADAGVDPSVANDGLNAVTAGDSAEAFRGFVADVNGGRGAPAGPAILTDDERAQIEQLQDQLDGGEITAEQFAAGVDGLLGDQAPQAAFAGFGFFGSAHGVNLGERLAARLNLTDEQIAAARELFRTAHQQIRVLRLTAIAKIRQVLTPEQRNKLDQLRADHFSALREAAGGARPAARRGGAIRERIRTFIERLATELGITDEQRQAIEAIRTQLRANVRAAHQAARDAFRALLTDEQRAILDRIEAAAVPQREGA